MALQPNLSPLIIAGPSTAPHTMDIFLDYVCPYSAKMCLHIDSILKPLFEPGGKYAGKVKVIFRPHVQAWHGTSTYVHEAGLACLRAAPEKFWEFSLALMKNQGDYFDIPASSMTSTQIKDKLAELAATVIPQDKVAEFRDLLAFKSSANGGTAVTDDLKYTIKFSRQNHIHVSPTVLFDGIAYTEVSSGWEEADWSEFLASQIIV